MYSIFVTAVSAVVIVLTRIIFGKNERIGNAGTFKLVILSISGVLASIFICAALGNRFYWLIIAVTVFFASLIQINYAKRVERYNETGK